MVKKETSNAATGFMKSLKTYLVKHYNEDYYIGSLYFGENTITYFPFTPRELKERKLKIAIVYNHPANRFEIWLAGQNKNIQKQYWEMFKDSDWGKYNIPSKISEGFSIVDHIIVNNPDFSDSVLLREKIASTSLIFIKDIQNVLLIK